MALTVEQLNRATLARQALLAREPLAVPAAVRRVVALQAQEPASPYIALWARIAGFDPADLDAAFASGAVVKASLMRITLHAVVAEDYPAFHEAMLANLRASRLNDRRFKLTGLTPDDADALLPHLLDLAARPCTRAEVEALLAERLGAPPDPGVWWALRTFAPLVHAPTGGTWSYGPTPSFLAAPAGAGRDSPDRSLARLVWRYLEGFGPATPADFGQFALQRKPPVTAAFAALADRLVRLEGPDGEELFDVPDGPRPAGDTPAPARLLPMWDSTLLAWADRRRIIDAADRPVVTRRNGDVLATLLVDGRVAGVWRTVEGGIEASAFRPLPDDAWTALAAEARSLLAFLAPRDPVPYRRFNNWWTDLPAAQVELLRP
jgi:Winged helix DNA-binding domain